MSFLTVSGISKQVEGNHVLTGISFRQERFQKIAIAGETGSGKSTLLKIIAGLIQPDSGQVYFENERLLGPLEKLIPGHPRIAYLSQHFELRNNYRVIEVLEMANKLPETDSSAIYEVCRITHLLNRRTDQLSGGEKQRIATARLLISSPRLLLLDEPYSNLDMFHKSILKSVIHDIAADLKVTCILVSHDPLDTLSWANKIFVMKNGQIIQEGTPKQIYNEPVNEYSAGLFGRYNLIDPATTKAFTASSEIKANGKKLFVRPENFKIVTEGANTVSGIVVDVNFFGSYYELQVLISATIITVKTVDGNISNGDTVYVSLSAGKVWDV